MKDNKYTGLEIAVIGISCRLPDSNNYMEFWENLINKKKSIKTLDESEIIASGVHPDLLKDGNYVKAVSTIDGKEMFDSQFFKYSSAEAELLSPQQRILHESVWEALEDAGCMPEKTKGAIGLYLGTSDDFNWKIYANLNRHKFGVDDFSFKYLTNKDHLATLISYKLGLKGPAISMNTACSTSLASIDMACKGLLLGDANIAVAGGVSVSSEKEKGYTYHDGMVNSIDGSCRTFDKDSTGTIWADGVGIVVLKRLKNAIEDKDNIHCIIKGSGINNDGKRRIGYTAPSIEGQSECITKAHKFSKIDSKSIGYIEAHGTGTKLGDPIEIEALNIAFNREKEKTCAIGSVKSNLGHLNAAAGVAGFIKAALALKFKKIPPTVDFVEPNPQIDFNGGPFYVNTTVKNWENKDKQPLRAAVSSFGIGGSNVHIVLEEAPLRQNNEEKNGSWILPFSAKSNASLNSYINKFSSFAKDNDLSVADAAYTLQKHRMHFEYRKSFVVGNKEELINHLDEHEDYSLNSNAPENIKKLIFMYTGHGSQYTNMGKNLYVNEPVFREKMDQGFEILKKITGKDFKEILYPDTVQENSPIKETYYAQPITVMFEYALTCLMTSKGISPSFMIGHSLGEYVTACISGVFDFETLLSLIIKRVELVETLPEGKMVSVFASQETINEFLNEEVSIALVNGDANLVLSGTTAAVNKIIAQFDALHISYVELSLLHSFHSDKLDPILPQYREKLEQINFAKPKTPYISNVTGEFITDEQATSPDYWVSHMRNTVQFSKGMNTVSSMNNTLLVEVGTGDTLTKLAKNESNLACINLIKSSKEDEGDDWKYLLEKIGSIWENGGDINWAENTEASKISLPAYSFDPIQYISEISLQDTISNNFDSSREFEGKSDKWFYQKTWVKSLAKSNKAPLKKKDIVLLFMDRLGVGDYIKANLTKENIQYIEVYESKTFEKVNNNTFHINPKNESDYELLFTELDTKALMPNRIFHLWTYTNEDTQELEYLLDVGYRSLLHTVRLLDKFYARGFSIDFVSNDLFKVINKDTLTPIKATALGVVKTIPIEFLNAKCRAIDINDHDNKTLETLWEQCLMNKNFNEEVAVRNGYKYYRDYIKTSSKKGKKSFVKNGVYLITGGSGGMGFEISKHLAEEYQAKLIWIGRSDLPEDKIADIKKLGGNVLYIKSNLKDEALITEIITNAEEEFGNIMGVLHTAGTGKFSGAIMNRTEEDDQGIFAAKIYGTQVLNTFFKDRKLDFWVNFSSRAATIPYFGLVAYCASNIYLDHLAETTNSYISIQWPMIKDVGMAVKLREELTENQRDEQLKDGISSVDVIAILKNAISYGIPNQIISPQDLHQQIDQHKKSQQNLLLMTDKGENRAVESANYSPAITPHEKKLVELVQQLLGVNKVGRNDSFFELGGDSLKAMVLINQIRQEYEINIALKDIFENLVVHELATFIEEQETIKNDEKKVTIVI